jgi:hypothetical protein
MVINHKTVSLPFASIDRPYTTDPKYLEYKENIKKLEILKNYYGKETRV